MNKKFKVVLAYLVHAFTATGLIFALLAMWCISHGNYKWYFIFLTITVLIDAVDGTMARKFEVKKYAPNIDGALLDNIIDYITFVFLPAYFVYASGILETPYALIAGILILLSSSYQFCQTDAKLEAGGEHFFLGFPSYWNILVLYLFWWNFGSIASFAIIAFLVIMIFVPLKWVYPSRTKTLLKVTSVLMSIYSVATLYEIMFNFENPHSIFMYFSVFIFIYYAVLSIFLNIKIKKSSS